MDTPPHSDSGQSGGGDTPAEQRREHVRVALLRRCAVTLPNDRQRGAELVDLSGTGCGFVISGNPQIGDVGIIQIDFDEWSLGAPIEVMYVRVVHAGRPYVGARFYDLVPQEVDQIVREVFATMRRQLRNTRGGG